MRRRLFLLAQVLFALAVVWYASGSIVRQWQEARVAGFGFQLNWLFLLLSTVLVGVIYVMLIEAWRGMVVGWGARLSFGDAARIWFVSNLGRYVPGKIWAITAMGALAEQSGVPAVTATTSAILVNLISLVAGVGVIALTGSRLLDNPTLVVGGAVILGVVVVAVPTLLPGLARLAARVSGRSITIPRLPNRPIWIAAVAAAASWVGYGIAFQLFAKGVAPAASGSTVTYIAVFTTSYLAGYVTLFAPGGIGVREVALLAFLEQSRLATGGAGVLIVVASRLWLALLEVVPGLLLLMSGGWRTTSRIRSTE